MNQIDRTIHVPGAVSVQYTDKRLAPAPTVPWLHRFAAIAVGDIVAAYFATLPFTGLNRMDPATLPFTQYGIGLFTGYALTFLVAGLLPALLMARVQLEKGFPSIGVAAVWGVLIGFFVYLLAVAWFAFHFGWVLVSAWTPYASFLLMPALLVGALGGLAGWAYLSVTKQFIA